MNDSLRQRRFIYHTLFTKWNEIIGDDISALTCPVRMRFSRRNDGAVLTVRINSALGAEMQLRAKNICERINQFYGREAVKKIKFETVSGNWISLGPRNGIMPLSTAPAFWFRILLSLFMEFIPNGSQHSASTPLTALFSKNALCVQALGN